MTVLEATVVTVALPEIQTDRRSRWPGSAPSRTDTLRAARRQAAAGVETEAEVARAGA
jgi:hypothetical protein